MRESITTGNSLAKRWIADKIDIGLDLVVENQAGNGKSLNKTKKSQKGMCTGGTGNILFWK
jgi:hypothetical protein